VPRLLISPISSGRLSRSAVMTCGFAISRFEPENLMGSAIRSRLLSYAGRALPAQPRFGHYVRRWVVEAHKPAHVDVDHQGRRDVGARAAGLEALQFV
jgi:hypothetical protein